VNVIVFGVFQVIKKWRRDKPIETILNLAVSFHFYPKIEVKKDFHAKTINICDLFYTLITPKFQILTKIWKKYYAQPVERLLTNTISDRPIYAWRNLSI
jgi:hypothetical protein